MGRWSLLLLVVGTLLGRSLVLVVEGALLGLLVLVVGGALLGLLLLLLLVLMEGALLGRLLLLVVGALLGWLLLLMEGSLLGWLLLLVEGALLGLLPRPRLRPLGVPVHGVDVHHLLIFIFISRLCEGFGKGNKKVVLLGSGNDHLWTFALQTVVGVGSFRNLRWANRTSSQSIRRLMNGRRSGCGSWSRCVSHLVLSTQSLANECQPLLLSLLKLLA